MKTLASMTLISLFAASAMAAEKTTLKCTGKFDKTVITLEASGPNIGDLKITSLVAGASLIEEATEDQEQWRPRKVSGTITVVKGKIFVHKEDGTIGYPYYEGYEYPYSISNTAFEVTLNHTHFSKSSKMVCDLTMTRTPDQ